MKVWWVSVDDVKLGVVVDHTGQLEAGGVISLWNSEKPSYQADSAEEPQLVVN